MVFAPEDIQSRLRDQPFSPLRITTTAGQSFDVYHPDLVLVGERFLIVGLPSSKNPTVADQVTRIPLFHVTELRDFPNPAPPANGSRA